MEQVEEDSEVLGASEDVLTRIEGVRHSEAPRRGSHELHQALGPLRRDGVLVELGLDLDDRPIRSAGTENMLAPRRECGDRTGRRRRYGGRSGSG